MKKIYDCIVESRVEFFENLSSKDFLNNYNFYFSCLNCTLDELEIIIKKLKDNKYKNIRLLKKYYFEKLKEVSTVLNIIKTGLYHGDDSCSSYVLISEFFSNNNFDEVICILENVKKLLGYNERYLDNSDIKLSFILDDEETKICDIIDNTIELLEDKNNSPKVFENIEFDEENLEAFINLINDCKENLNGFGKK